MIDYMVAAWVLLRLALAVAVVVLVLCAWEWIDENRGH